jgi:hypothetical protein
MDNAQRLGNYRQVFGRSKLKGDYALSALGCRVMMYLKAMLGE